MLDFCNNEDFRHFYAYFSEANGKLLTASFKTPATLKGKAVVFLKGPNANKVTRDNIENDVILYDCSPNPLEHLDVMTREVFLPLLSMEQTGGISADKLMDLLHRLTSSVQALNGNSKVSRFYNDSFYLLLLLAAYDKYFDSLSFGLRYIRFVCSHYLVQIWSCFPFYNDSFYLLLLLAAYDKYSDSLSFGLQYICFVCSQYLAQIWCCFPLDLQCSLVRLMEQ